MTTGVGTGTTILFTTASGNYAGEVIGASIDGEEVPVIDMTHFGTTGYREKVFGSLVEPPQLTVNINFDPEEPSPVGVVDDVTVTFPDATTLTGSGAFISRSSEVPLEDKMTGTYVFQFDGVTGPTYS